MDDGSERAMAAARRALDARDGRPLDAQLALTRIAVRWLAGGRKALSETYGCPGQGGARIGEGGPRLGFRAVRFRK